MHATVTAILVASRGAEHLQRTLDAVRAQTRAPDAIVVLGMDADDATSALLAAARPTQLLAATQRMPFGKAIATAERSLPPVTGDDEWLWLLAQDTAPEPEALERLMATVEVSPSVAIAGPKLVDWQDGAFIRELGLAMTPAGASVPLVEDELDQAQHDGVSDVLSVPSAGMLVRRAVFDELGGFDPGLPVIDDGLDLGVRARLAGHRVALVPRARVAMAGDGVSGPARSNRWSVRRRLYRAGRAAQLHRRMVYAPRFALVFHWLSLVPLAIIRSIGWLLGKQPAAIGGELAAAFATAFGAGHIGEARRRLARTKRVGWAAIAPLRIPHTEVRRSRALKREASLVRQRGERRELNFFSGGGAWVVVGMAVLNVALFAPLLGSATIGGGGLLPLAGDVGSLWAGLGYGWRDLGIGFVGAADPFAAVLAVLGSVTFWQPSFVLVLLWFTALPLAALGAWFFATRITHRAGLRATFAIVWALAPMLFAALQSGRPGPALVHLLLPWLFFAGSAARRSWAASATAALLAAAVLACAPSLAPALLVLWLLWLGFSGRSLMRVIGIPIPALALFVPLVVQQVARGDWLALLADPGSPVAGGGSKPWQLALGIPDATLPGWPAVADALGLPHLGATLLVPVLLAPIAVLALLALFLRGTIRATLSLVVAFVGYLTAVLATVLVLAGSGQTPVGVWPGSALSLYWFGVSAAATMGMVALGRFAVAPAWIAVVALAAAVGPLAIGLPVGNSAVRAGAPSMVPAYVQAAAAEEPRVATLRIQPQPGGGIAADLVHGEGQTLDQQSTLVSTQRGLTADQRDLARLAGNLASASGLDESPLLKRFGISFVLVAPADTASGTDASLATERRATSALDGNALFAQVGSGASGVLWTVTRPVASVPVPPAAGAPLRLIVLVAQAAVMLFALLLSIPTGRGERGSLRRPTVAELAAGAAGESRSRAGRASRTGPGHSVTRSGHSMTRSVPSATADAPSARPDAPSTTAEAPSATPGALGTASPPRESDGVAGARLEQVDDVHLEPQPATGGKAADDGQ